MSRAQLVVALDVPTVDEAKALASKVRASADLFKVGLELFVDAGPRAVTEVREAGGRPIFLDLKLHDIPETVERAVARACGLGAAWLTVHASGGPRMLSRAVERAAKEGSGLSIVAVTVLTSLDAGDLRAVGIPATPEAHALELARMAWAAGVRAFVCSPAEVARLREALGPDALLVTPGVRPAGSALGDQKRVDTPEGAVARGASAVVVGRPIRDASDPAAAAAEIARALRAS
ncbi:MAG TPA: orotidine-5'-phosphate decarboxylase [Polyangiaceae bacterium]|nr:orotidine-5'-phosphate decarboxylase [Polyangiaceae bacterium]